MTDFSLHTLTSAPQQSVSALQALQQNFGFIPNIAAKMATSPVLIQSFISVFQNVHGGSFSEAQIQTLLLTNAVTNACSYAVALHTALALKEGLPPADVHAMRDGRLPQNTQYAALSGLARNYIEKRGQLDDTDLQTFLAAGFSREQVLEVITVVAASTITNYVGNLTRPPLEETFLPYLWTAATDK